MSLVEHKCKEEEQLQPQAAAQQELDSASSPAEAPEASAKSDDAAASNSMGGSKAKGAAAASSSPPSLPAGVDRSQLALYTHLPSPVAIPPNSIHLTYLHSFLSAVECSTLLFLSEGEFSHSVTASGITAYRTSFSAGLPQSDPTVCAIRLRVAQLSGVNETAVEKLQVVRYEPGQQYKPHYDSSTRLRHFTIFAYLNDVEGGGGETEFTKLGIKFNPKCGDALLWENRTTSRADEYHVDGEHAGLPPVSDTKYGLNCWVKFASL